MARIFITGSADGLGQLAARELVRLGHNVVLHARDAKRGKDALAGVPGAESVVTADLSNVSATKRLAEDVNELDGFDAVIHNAAVYRSEPGQIFAVNVLAPYILTCMITRPERLIYMSSGMHGGGEAKLDAFKSDPQQITYS
ncbi:MAG TPA: SDR family NAD(P)-dependent oxidoreductase, partial [Pyrinomonadaceae bacterium]|nr:SDR family NAD(P)-dependent oxidoreductase [Pyrinomonadaceae bacterium]